MTSDACKGITTDVVVQTAAQQSSFAPRSVGILSGRVLSAWIQCELGPTIGAALAKDCDPGAIRNANTVKATSSRRIRLERIRARLGFPHGTVKANWGMRRR